MDLTLPGNEPPSWDGEGGRREWRSDWTSEIGSALLGTVGHRSLNYTGKGAPTPGRLGELNRAITPELLHGSPWNLNPKFPFQRAWLQGHVTRGGQKYDFSNFCRKKSPELPNPRVNRLVKIYTWFKFQDNLLRFCGDICQKPPGAIQNGGPLDERYFQATFACNLGTESGWIFISQWLFFFLHKQHFKASSGWCKCCWGFY